MRLASVKVYLLAATLMWAPLLQAQIAGSVNFAQGNATVSGTSGLERPLAAGASVSAGDTLRTAAGAEIHVLMADGGLLALRGGSQLTIDRFAAQGDAKDGATFSLARGAMRAVTGWLSKINSRAVTFVTPQATIGIRGTDFDLIAIPAGTEAAGESAGTHGLVREGTIAMVNGAGEQVINPKQAGFAREGAVPGLHSGTPEFFARRAGQFDARVDDHARDIGGHMERSLRERSLLQGGETLNDHLNRRREEVRIRERGNPEEHHRPERRAKAKRPA